MNGVGMPDRLGMSAAVDIDASHTKATRSAEGAKTKQMAQEFEAMFLRQILTSAKVGGSAKPGGGGGDGYQSMGVDALASTLSKNGGLGLARQIEALVGQTEHRILNPPGTSSDTAADTAPGTSARTAAAASTGAAAVEPASTSK